MWDFNKATTDDNNTGVGNKTIAYCGNTVDGLSIHNEITFYFDLEVYDEAHFMFRLTGINDTGFAVGGEPDIVNSWPLLVTVVIIV